MSRQVPTHASSLEEDGSESDIDSLLLGRQSDRTPTLSIVMPTLNEEKGIARCLESAKDVIEELGVPTEIIVSDSSTDRTPEIAHREGAIVVTPPEEGYGNAYRHAFEHARGDYIAMGDADCTYDFTDLKELYQMVAFDGADLAMGSRLEGEIKPGAMPSLHKYVGNPLLTAFLNQFYDTDVTDAHSGLRVIRRDALEALDLESTGMEFASEMIMRAAEQDFKIAEKPITYHEREGDATLDSFQDGFRHLQFMLVNAPTYLYSFPALGFSAAGTSIMAISMLGLSLFGVTFGTHTIITGSMMMILGFQVGTLAVFSALAADPIKQPDDPLTRWVYDHMRIQHGMIIGSVLVILGGGAIGGMFGRYVTSGFTELPFVNWHMVAYTAVVIGVLTIFQTLFLSMFK